ncbi:galactose mutarotase-like domain-containing protein [Ganoderma leucocontextum]|nr:galactose mutarotase-like domain-containing protein [Ganoderma leucocontextum]
MYPRATLKFALLAQLASLASATYSEPTVLDACPGYQAKDIFNDGHKLTADLVLGRQGLQRLQGSYVKITDPADNRYEVPEEVLPRPKANFYASPLTSNIRFNYTVSPFSFSIYRSKTHEVLFSTASHPIIFEPQHLRVKTNLSANANIYGLGEHSDTFRLPTHDYTPTGTHGVLLVNSNGMDIKLNDTEGAGTTLKYNAIGGVLDFYFLAGSESDPTELARQYADVVGTPAEVPYWSFGFHQSLTEIADYIDVSEVITNCSAAGIPLETMWTDIGESALLLNIPGRGRRCRLYGPPPRLYCRPPESHTSVTSAYEKGDGLDVRGWYGHATGANVSRVRFANTKSASTRVMLNGRAVAADRLAFDSSTGVLDVTLDIPFKSSSVVELY